MGIKDYAGYESYEQMLRHAYHHGGGVDLDYDGVKLIVEFMDRAKKLAEYGAELKEEDRTLFKQTCRNFLGGKGL